MTIITSANRLVMVIGVLLDLQVIPITVLPPSSVLPSLREIPSNITIRKNQLQNLSAIEENQVLEVSPYIT
ncbi:MAG: hypothetical protein WAZ77_18835 [Candidatus Nitrosopolaris sp.]